MKRALRRHQAIAHMMRRLDREDRMCNISTVGSSYRPRDDSMRGDFLIHLSFGRAKYSPAIFLSTPQSLAAARGAGDNASAAIQGLS